MDLITSLNLGTAAELAISAVIIFALTQAVKQTRLDNRWLPWVSMAIGIVAGLVAVMATNDNNWFNGGLMGLLVGAAVSGLFDGFKGFSSKSFGTTEIISNPTSAVLPKQEISDDLLKPSPHENEKDDKAQPKGGE
ncbi:YrzE family protein [Lacticaseibacillus brantae]|uniref:Holin n=1 Tax=Lacticaseibacillus brantae DSM 23927 TaxID=1423727 RepID=A0A0R2B4X8_9LACO|nr:YrzE family protein [Lacticaseibacillus brantae]KRM72996.1 hypothetical protein FC34_GL000714 [Lacticaseibacillus brantae DSM 23927]